MVSPSSSSSAFKVAQVIRVIVVKERRAVSDMNEIQHYSVLTVNIGAVASEEDTISRRAKSGCKDDAGPHQIYIVRLTMKGDIGGSPILLSLSWSHEVGPVGGSQHLRRVAALCKDQRGGVPIHD